MSEKYVIIITSQHDFSTIKVIDYLISLKQPYIVINENSLLSLNYLRLPNNGRSEPQFSITITNIIGDAKYEITESSILSVWYRRGNLSLNYHSKNSLTDNNPEINAYFDQYNREQAYITTQFLSELLSSGFKHINRIEDNFLNKLTVLNVARKVGLTTPESLITSDKRRLTFDSTLINKSLLNPVYFRYSGGMTFGSLTELITSEREKELPDKFPLSFFQSTIKKLFEIRTFFLNSSFYSMAIISQNDSQTTTDFRNYNDENPNRFLPYQLPYSIERKIKKLCRVLNVNCGSVDILYSTDKQYYFLEINPVGQYDMVSVPCNYDLHEKIANYLSNNN